jgi:hypothetical protein
VTPIIIAVITDHNANETIFDSSNKIMKVNKPSKVSVLEKP